MNFTTEILTDVNENEWNKTLTKSKASTAFQIASIYRPHQAAFGSKPFFILVKKPTGEIVGQLSTVVHFKNYWLNSNVLSSSLTNKLNLGSTLSWINGPIIHDSSNQDQIFSLVLTAVDRVAKENKVLMIKGSSPPLALQIPKELYAKNGYDYKRWVTYITNLNQKQDELFHSLHNKTRYDVRKGEKNSLTFEVVNKRSVLEEYAEVKFQGVKRKNNIIKRNIILRDNLWENLYKNGYEKLFVVRHKGILVGGIMNMIFNRNIVEHSVTNSPRRDLFGGSFLTWNTIKWSVENDYSTYDVGGANPLPVSEKEKGIRFFKSKWGGKEIDYALFTKILDKTRLRIFRTIAQPNRIFNKIVNHL